MPKEEYLRLMPYFKELYIVPDTDARLLWKALRTEQNAEVLLSTVIDYEHNNAIIEPDYEKRLYEYKQHKDIKSIWKEIGLAVLRGEASLAAVTYHFGETKLPYDFEPNPWMISQMMAIGYGIEGKNKELKANVQLIGGSYDRHEYIELKNRSIICLNRRALLREISVPFPQKPLNLKP